MFLHKTLVGSIFMSVVLSLQGAGAQNYPSKPVRVINPYALGGPHELIGRQLWQFLSTATGQQFVMDTKPGANGNIGAEEVVRSAPDGYTLLFATTSQLSINPSLYKMPFDVQRDLAPVTQVSLTPSSVVVNASFPVKSMQEFLAYAKANPGKISYGSAGNGSINHLAAELLAMVTGTKMLHVPFKGGGPALTELMAGRIEMFIVSPPGVMAQVKAGKLKILTVSSPKRMAQLPDVPTMIEAGVPDWKAEAGTGLLAPSKTPLAVIRRLNDELVKFLHSADGEAKLGGLGVLVVGNSPAEFEQLIKEETARWAAVIKAGNISIN